MASALIHKSWTDLSRRPTRTILTTLTLALAVASFGILALPSLMNRAMTSEVSAAHLYDLKVPINNVALSPAQLHELTSLPNVTALTARSMFATRTLVGARRVATEVWGVPNFAEQQVDRVITAARPGPGQVLVDGQDSALAISSAKQGDVLSIQGADGMFHPFTVAGSARAVALNLDTITAHLVLYADQQTVDALGGLTGVNLLEFRLRDTSGAAAQATIADVRRFLARQAAPTAFADLPTIRAPGDWPLKAIFTSRSKVLDIVILLAVLSAIFVLANTIRTLVAEQTREIGIMRAVGASARDVRNCYLRTAALLGAAGALLGSALGIGIAYLLVRLFARMLFGIRPVLTIDWPVVAIGAVTGVAVAVLTAWPTLRRMARIPIHEALATKGLTAGFGSGPLDHVALHATALPTPTRVGLRNVARQKGRSGATTIQIALAVATLLGLASLALAISQVTNQSWNVLNYDITLSAQPGGHLYTPAIINQIQAQPGVAAVEAADWSQMSYQNQTLYALGVHATTFIQEPRAAGRWLTAADERSRANVAIIGSAAARRWQLHPGSTIRLATTAGAVQFSIIGVGASQANNGYNLYTTLAALQADTGTAGHATSLLIRASNSSHPAVDALATRLEDTLARIGYPSQSQVTYAGRATDQAQARSTLIIVEAIGLLTVAISMLGLINTLTMNIIERTREIGVLRCIGARASDLRRIFRTETITLALAGYLLAIPLGWLVARALQWLVLHVVGAELPAPYTARNLGYALIGTLLLAGLVITPPLRRATRLHPGEAIRYN